MDTTSHTGFGSFRRMSLVPQRKLELTKEFCKALDDSNLIVFENNGEPKTYYKEGKERYQMFGKDKSIPGREDFVYNKDFEAKWCLIPKFNFAEVFKITTLIMIYLESAQSFISKSDDDEIDLLESKFDVDTCTISAKVYNILKNDFSSLHEALKNPELLALLYFLAKNNNFSYFFASKTLNGLCWKTLSVIQTYKNVAEKLIKKLNKQILKSKDSYKIKILGSRVFGEMVSRNINPEHKTLKQEAEKEIKNINPRIEEIEKLKKYLDEICSAVLAYIKEHNELDSTTKQQNWTEGLELKNCYEKSESESVNLEVPQLSN